MRNNRHKKTTPLHRLAAVCLSVVVLMCIVPVDAAGKGAAPAALSGGSPGFSSSSESGVGGLGTSGTDPSLSGEGSSAPGPEGSSSPSETGPAQPAEEEKQEDPSQGGESAPSEVPDTSGSESVPAEPEVTPPSSEASETPIEEEEEKTEEEGDPEEEEGTGEGVHPGPTYGDTTLGDIIRTGSFHNPFGVPHPQKMLRQNRAASAQATFGSTVKNSGNLPQATLWIDVKGGVETSLQLLGGASETLSGLPVGTYTATITVPAGMVVEQVTLNGNTVKVQNRSFQFGASSSNPAKIQVVLAGSGARMMNSQGGVDNIVATDKWSSQHQVNLSAIPNPAMPDPYDVVLLVDLSGSMVDGMDGSPLPGLGDDPASRLSYLKRSVIKFLDTLVKNPPDNSRVAIAWFSTKGGIKQNWTSLTELATNPTKLQAFKNESSPIRVGASYRVEQYHSRRI